MADFLAVLNALAPALAALIAVAGTLGGVAVGSRLEARAAERLDLDRERRRWLDRIADAVAGERSEAIDASIAIVNGTEPNHDNSYLQEFVRVSIAHPDEQVRRAARDLRGPAAEFLRSLRRPSPEQAAPQTALLNSLEALADAAHGVVYGDEG